MNLNPQYETGVTGACGLRYNIQKAQASDGVWYQRHIWHLDQRGRHSPPIIEEWIPSYGKPENHMRKIS